SRLIRVAKEQIRTGRFVLLGERRDVSLLMQAADVFCQPNTKPEPFGLVFVEALGAGVPVVATAMGGALEIVDERCGRLVEPKREALANVLDRLIDDAPLRRELGEAGPGRALALCAPAVTMQSLEEAVRAVTAAPARERMREWA